MVVVPPKIRMARFRMREKEGLVLKPIGMSPKQRKGKAMLLKALQEQTVQRKYKQRLRKHTIVDGQLAFPRIRVLRTRTSHVQQQVIQELVLGQHRTVHCKDLFGPKDWFQTTLLIDVLGVAPVNVIYMQNLNLDDFQMRRMIVMLKSNKHIIAVNLGEVGRVSRQIWESLVDAIPETNICFLYVSEHQAGPDVTTRLKTLTKANRNKTTSRVDWRLVDSSYEITKMWWNPTKSKKTRSIP